MVLAILSMAVFQVRQGQPGAVPMLVLFAALSAATLGMLLRYMRGLEASLIRRTQTVAVGHA